MPQRLLVHLGRDHVAGIGGALGKGGTRCRDGRIPPGRSPRTAERKLQKLTGMIQTNAHIQPAIPAARS
jgi:hypothetical protein